MMKRFGVVVRRLLLCLALVCVSGNMLTAHPHMSIGSRLTFEYEGKVCKGFWVDWIFDDFFSAAIIEDYDTDKNGIFDTAETKEIYNTAFINLKKFGFFVLIREGDRRYSPDTVSDFSAARKGPELSYRFFVALATPPKDGEICVAIFDTTYFCATGFVDNPVRVLQKKGPAPKYEIAANKKFPVYYNPYGKADDNRVYTKWEEDLETAYPEEVRVYFDEAAESAAAAKMAPK